jgi:ABC-type Co2+ transport system permease subunit|tara:strand:- start:349 stop:504 length:156 start_codon:yes stop_codon:yes gene_type:complete
METIETILMLPWYAFKYAFSLAFWFYLVVFTVQSDWYYRVSAKIREKLDAR